MSQRVDWGDVVRVSPNASKEYRPGSVGDVCGLRTIPYTPGVIDVSSLRDSDELLVMVEFRDRVAIEIPERMLEVIERSSRK